MGHGEQHRTFCQGESHKARNHGAGGHRQAHKVEKTFRSFLSLTVFVFCVFTFGNTIFGHDVRLRAEAPRADLSGRQVSQNSQDSVAPSSTVSSSVVSNSAVSQSSIISQGVGLESSKDWSLFTTAFVKASLHEDMQDPRSTAESLFIFRPSFKLSESLHMGLQLGLSQGLNRAAETEVINSQVQLTSGKLMLGRELWMELQGAVSLPTNSRSYQHDTYRGGVILTPTFSSQWGVFGWPVNVSYTPSLSRLFHKYTRAWNSSPHLQYKLNQSLSLSTPIVGDMSFVLTGGWMTARSYQGHIIEFFNMAQTLSYTVNSRVSVSLGHTNEASPFEYNGRDHNIRIYDSRTSTLLGRIVMEL